MTHQEYALKNKKRLIDFLIAKDIEKIHFIGIDRSLTATGFAVVNAGKCIKSFEIGSKEYGDNRLYDIGKQYIVNIMSYSNNFVCMENYAYGISNSQSLTGLGELGGVCKVFFRMKNIDYLSVAPTLLKKYVSGSGISSKTQMMMFVLKKFKIEPVSDNTADAIGLAYLIYNTIRYAKGNKNYTQKEIECFDSFLSCEPKKKNIKKRLLQNELDLIDG